MYESLVISASEQRYSYNWMFKGTIKSQFSIQSIHKPLWENFYQSYLNMLIKLFILYSSNNTKYNSTYTNRTANFINISTSCACTHKKISKMTVKLTMVVLEHWDPFHPLHHACACHYHSLDPLLFWILMPFLKPPKIQYITQILSHGFWQ